LQPQPDEPLSVGLVCVFLGPGLYAEKVAPYPLKQSISPDEALLKILYMIYDNYLYIDLGIPIKRSVESNQYWIPQIKGRALNSRNCTTNCV
jgi:hypothetical protein